MACNCIRLRLVKELAIAGTYAESIIDLTNANQSGTFGNGQPYWQFFDATLNNSIEVSQDAGVGPWKIRLLESIPQTVNTGTELFIQQESGEDCPTDIKWDSTLGWNNFLFSDLGFDSQFPTVWHSARIGCCDNSCANGFYIYFDNGAGQGYALLNTPTGQIGGSDYWQFEPLLANNDLPSGFYMQLSRGTDGLSNWSVYIISAIGVDPTTQTDIWGEFTGSVPTCPSELTSTTADWTFSSVSGFNDLEIFASYPSCESTCTIYQNRTKKEYPSIKLPEIFEEEDRGYFRCCCEAIVLADPTSSDTWKNDVTSAWIKLSDVLDTASFDLYKDNTLATYQPSQVTFARESLGRYVTIPWQDVLNTDGAGCYRLDITFSIAGINQTFTWGKYKLKPYSIQNALETARVRAIFNAYNEIEQIDFRDSKVVDTLRFYGFIGNAQPNMEIDNIIYDNREMKKVIRENLNTYEIITDPICEDFTKALKDLYLLSENELFISDYNAHNHSYRYQDLPVIVTESPEIEYYDFSREAKLTCIVGDKFKNKRSYYK